MPYSIWILISLLLHLITIFGLIVLYLRYQSLRSQGLPPASQLDEQLHIYLQEIEQANETYYQKMIQYINEKEQIWLEAKQQPSSSLLSNDSSSSAHQEADFVPLQTKKLQSDEEEQSKRVDTKSFPLHAPEEVEQVLNLLEEGYSHQEIARRLNRGVGEIQLMINLYRSTAD